MVGLVIQLMNIVNEMIETASTSNDSPNHSMHSNGEEIMFPSHRTNESQGIPKIFITEEATVLLDIETQTDHLKFEDKEVFACIYN